MVRRGLGTIIDSRKNIVRETAAITGNTIFNFAKAVDSPDTTLATNAGNEVRTGSKIFRIFIELWVYGTLGSNVNNPFDWYISKSPAAEITSPSADTIDTSTSMKKWVLQQGKGLLGRLVDGSPPYVIKQWIKIPKSMQRMAHDDRLNLVIKSTGANFCVFFVYKYYM